MDAFEGVRVVELAQWVFVPVAGALLADWGADVIRIERLEGDPYRGLATQGIGTDSGGVNLSMALANRGKRSVALNLRQKSGLAVLHELLATADVFLTSLRPRRVEPAGTRRRHAAREVPPPGLRTRPRLRDTRPGRRPARLRQLGVLGARGTWATSSPRPSGTTRSASAAPWATETARWHWLSASRRRCSSGSEDGRRLGGRRLAALDRDVDAVVGSAGGSKGGAGRTELAAGLRSILWSACIARRIVATSADVFAAGDRYWPDFCRVVGRHDLIEDPRFADLTVRRANADACVAELDCEFARARSSSGRSCSPISTHRGRRCSPCRSWSTIHRSPPTAMSARCVVDGEAAYRLPAVPVQFDEQAAATAARARARRGHGGSCSRNSGTTWTGDQR